MKRIFTSLICPFCNAYYRRRSRDAGGCKRCTVFKSFPSTAPDARSRPATMRCCSKAPERLNRGRARVSEMANMTLHNAAPYVGHGAFAHKGGVHVEEAPSEA